MVWVAVLGVISLSYLATAWTAARGRPTAPLDDTYITFQYARQIALGHPYQYNDGDAATTSMTSPLYGFLLAGVYRLGLTDERLVAFALAAGVVWLSLIAWLTYRLAFHLLGESAGMWKWLATFLVVLTGSVQWGCFNGMETGLFTVLTLAALDAFLQRRMGVCAVWLGLAGLARPGGLVLAALVWAAIFLDGFSISRTVPWKRLLWPTAAVLVASVPLFVNWMLTGTTLAMGLQAKSWWLNVPVIPFDILRAVMHSYRDIVLGEFLGWASPNPWFVPPGLLVFSIIGWGALGIQRRWTTLLVTVGWFLVHNLSNATLITATWQLGRYQAPHVPVMLVLAVSGLAFVYQRVGSPWRRRLLPSLVALFLLASSFYSTVRFVDFYRQAISTLSRQQLVVADWLRENLPADTRVAVSDAGSLRYVGQRPTYDLIGLTTPDAAIAWRHGSGSVFEMLEHSAMRPDYFAIFPDIFFVPYLASTDLFAAELFRVEVPDAAIASPSTVKGVWRADWRLADSGARFYQSDILARTAGLRLMDTLDVADLRDEATHDVQWWQDVIRPGFPSEVRQFKYRVPPGQEVLDGGRLLTGGIAFTVATKPGEPLWIVARLHAQEAGAVRVQVDGRDVGRWAYAPAPGQWLETVFRVPADAVSRTRTRIVLRVDADNPDFRHYAPYYYWFLQGEPDLTPPAIQHSTPITFAEGIHLLGFDLPQAEWRPGDVLPVTLYWQATEPIRSNAKVFLHLYDSAGNLAVQSDGWVFYDTRPPYTWQPGEVVIGHRPLALPADLSAGQYSLAIGLYEPDVGQRLPVYRSGVRQAEDRAALTTLVVR